MKRLLLGLTLIVGSAPAQLTYADRLGQKVVLPEKTCIDPLIKMRRDNPDSQSGLTQIVATMQAADINQDNRICASEIQQFAPKQSAGWAEFDVDQDGCITPPEARATIERRLDLRWRGEYHFLDSNKDNKLTFQELKVRFPHTRQGAMSPEEIMDNYDQDFDGSVTEEEYVAQSIEYLRLMRKKL